MDHEIAFIVASTLLGIAIVVWLVALEYAASVAAPPADLALESDWEPGLVNVTVEVPAKAPLERYVPGLMRGLTNGLQSAGIDPQFESRDHNAFSLSGVNTVGSAAGGPSARRAGWPPGFTRAEVTVGGGTGGYVVDFRFDAREKVQKYLRIGRALQFFLAVPFITVLAFIVFNFAVPSDEPDLRIQAVQMIQSVHVLWPPFMLYTMANARRKRLTTIAETAAKNAAYTAE
jgi:hypothetical protein